MNAGSEKAAQITSESDQNESECLTRPVMPMEGCSRPMSMEVVDDEGSLKRRLENAEREIEKSKKQIKHLKKELTSAEKERKEILSTVSSLYVQVQYWNTWLGKNFSGHMEKEDKSKLSKEGEKIDEKQISSENDNHRTAVLNSISEKDESELKTAENDSSSNGIYEQKQQNNESKIEGTKLKENNDLSNVADMLKETAQSALANTGMSYDERTGLYYDCNSHMYYDPTSRLYYDNDNGIYYYYDAEKKNYVFHSQIKVPEADPSSPESNNERSEGEISSSDECDETQKVPCIRAIVKSSTSLKAGSLYLVTCNGATVGRDVKHLLHVTEVEASKDHAEIKYQQNDHQYYIQDVGSINGTFLNDQRLSDSKVESEWTKIKHKDYLKIGMTILCLHVHYGQETCDECEPGQVQALLSAALEQEKGDLNLSGLSREALRRKELKGLKKKYMVSGDGLREAMEPVSSGKYKDRADKRRKTIGSSNPVSDRPSVASKASVTEKISQENKGHKMMQKMGWNVGEGLGKEKTGIREPINVIVREKNKGLGTGVSKSVDEVGRKSSNYKWKKAKQRYDDIVHQEKTGEDGNEEMSIDQF